MAELTEKQKRFCDYYIETGNAAEAARLAGYSERTARSVGQENLTKPDIRARIDERLAELEAGRVAKADEVMRYLTSVMRREADENVVVTIRDEYSRYEPDEKGTMRKVTHKTEKSEVVPIPARLSDSNKAAELLGRRYAMWSDKPDDESNRLVVQFIDDIPKEDV